MLSYVTVRCISNTLEVVCVAVPRAVFNRVAQHAVLCPNGDWAYTANHIESAIGPWLQLPGAVIEKAVWG